MATWCADGASQDDLMLKDECLMVNYLDEVVGHENKYNVHKFVVGQPTGLVHRAFSVMLFDSQGRLLLQQRASSKITFADVWTNTCCSHPLYGMNPSEYDEPSATASGNPVGVKRAAVRKLKHELGIESLSPDRFTFISRVHYWACDLDTHGPKSPWGEHEIDYLLVCKLAPGESCPLKPNLDEVRDTMWVTEEELRAGMKDPAKKWSPWFRIIAERFVSDWWKDLDNIATDYSTIHRFDCHGLGEKIGAGGAEPGFLDGMRKEDDPLEVQRKRLLADVATTTAALSGKTSNKKQGAYGKVATHKTPLASSLFEVGAALKFKVLSGLEKNLVADDDDSRFCDDMLGKVSRSFAAVIRQLPREVCMDICVFYLVLRALDTIEDDMEFYKGKEQVKEEQLRKFYSTLLVDSNCSIDGVGEGDERVLLQKFGAVVRVFKLLPPESRSVISDITRDMGAGMADAVSAELSQGTADVDEYNRYCHAVAGLVGEGLTRIFVARGMESSDLAEGGEMTWPFCDGSRLGLANSMGLFLQKTNIIRDYLEDYVDGRAFWPKSIWRAYANCDDLGELSRPTARGGGGREPELFSKTLVRNCLEKGASSRSLACLDHLVVDALELVPDVLEYLARCRTPAVYTFCAIPQIMAIATLAEVFDDPRLFTGVVKIRKGMTARIILDSQKGHLHTLAWFDFFARDLAAKIDDCSASPEIKDRLRNACGNIVKLTAPAATKVKKRSAKKAILLSLAATAALLLTRRRRLSSI